MKLLQVDTIEQVKEKMNHYFHNIKLSTEDAIITDMLGKTAAEDVFSQIDIPEFNRSTVDGYAIVSKDAYGASESLPVFLEMIGKVDMGEASAYKVTSGKAVYVPTGGMIPEGADAVMMIEYVEIMDDNTIAVYAPAAPGDGIIFKGDDIRKDMLLIKKGCRITPQIIGVLAAVGQDRIKVFKRPRAAVISTGDEIVEPFGEVAVGQIRDINTYTISAFLTEAGVEVTFQSVISDNFELLKKTIDKLADANDLIIISGGSSAGLQDVTAQVIDSFGEPGVFVHGVAVKPGKPTIIGKVRNTAVFGLPGHPVSAIIIYKVFTAYMIDRLFFREARKLSVQAVCSANLHASPGKETYQMVELQETADGYIAVPVHAKSAAIFHIIRSDGYIQIPHNKEGIKKGEQIQVTLF